MVVNGLRLPDAFVALIDQAEPIVWWTPRGGNEGWVFKVEEGDLHWVRNGDADADDWLDDLQLIASLAEIEKATHRLPITFHLADYVPEEIEAGNIRYSHLPGWIPFIKDFSQIVIFGETGCQEPYCFDYRENRQVPSIIHWDDAYWRRVAMRFDAFISLFEPLGNQER